jgi:transposase
MTRFVGLDVSQKMTAICVIDNAGRRLWRGQCSSVPEQIRDVVLRHAGDNVRIGIETGAMTPWLVHELRNLGLEVVCLDARHARATEEELRCLRSSNTTKCVLELANLQMS